MMPTCLCCDEPGNVRCDTCQRKGCTFIEEKCHGTLLRAIAERRQDAEFMARLRERMEQDAPLLDQLRTGECKSARLVESRDGGAVLIYECECGARLARTREQAEGDAL